MALYEKALDCDDEALAQLHAREARVSEARLDILTFWRKWSIDAVTVHVQAPEAALVALPVVIFDWAEDTDVNALLAVLCASVKEALEQRRAGSSAVVTKRIVRHKKADLEIGGHRYIIPACWSDRPGFEILVADGSGHAEPRVVAHVYAAMGLSHQHSLQQVLLARTYSMEAAATVARVCQAQLGLGPPCVSVVATVEDGGPALYPAWQADAEALGVALAPLPQSRLARWSEQGSALQHWDGQGDDAALLADAVGEVPEVQDPALWLQCVEALRQVAAAGEPSLSEPRIAWRHAQPSCRSPPGLVADGQGLWAGELLFGTLDHAISEPWLRWRGITLVVCVLGRRVGQAEHPDYTTAAANRFPCVQYMNWSVNYEQDRRRYEGVFRRIAQELDNPSGRVLVHCKHGKDRSAFAVFAFLRLVHSLTDDDARLAVAVRRDAQGRPLVNLDRAGEPLHAWLEMAVEMRER